MASSRRLIFGNPPFKFLVGHLAQDEEFIADLRHVLEVSEDDCNRLATQLNKAGGFLDLPAVLNQVEGVLGEGEQARKIAKLIYRVAGMLHDADIPAKEAIAELDKALEEKTVALEAKDRGNLVRRISQLAVNPDGMAKQFKARSLSTATGAELSGFRVICDVRPVFDDARKKIEGAIPLSMISIEYGTQDGESLVVEMRVSEEQLDGIAEEIDSAKRKIGLIRELLVTQKLPVPRLKVKLDEDESNV